MFIEELDPNMWYKSIGWEPYDQTSTGVMNMPLKIYYSKNSKDLVFISQEVATGSDGSVIYYYGTFPYSTYQTVLDVVNTRIAKASFSVPSYPWIMKKIDAPAVTE